MAHQFGPTLLSLGGDNKLVYGDKLAMTWAIRSPSLEKSGCMIACQAGEAGKSSGNKYLPVGEIADICHMENVRTSPISQADDQYLDDTPYGKEKAPEAGRKADAEVSGGYTDNKLVDGEPEFALKDNLSAPPYWIVDAQKVPFDNSKHTVGAEVPSIIISPFVGDRGDFSLAQKRKDGICTVEFSRELVTGSQTDVQFDDRNKRNVFGVAVFDNAGSACLWCDCAHHAVQKLARTRAFLRRATRDSPGCPRTDTLHIKSARPRLT